MLDITHVSDRDRSTQSHVTRARESRPANWFPRVARHDLVALRKAREAQAFSAYAHARSREEYERRDDDRAAQWQRLRADATRGAIMYRELARMLLSAGSD